MKRIIPTVGLYATFVQTMTWFIILIRRKLHKKLQAIAGWLAGSHKCLSDTYVNQLTIQLLLPISCAINDVLI